MGDINSICWGWGMKQEERLVWIANTEGLRCAWVPGMGQLCLYGEQGLTLASGCPPEKPN